MLPASFPTVPHAPVALNPEHFRALLRRHGQPCRWLQAIPCACQSPGNSDASRGCGECEQGHLYAEQELDAGVRIFIDKTTRGIEDAEMGLLPRGTSTIMAMPDEVTASFADKILLPSGQKQDKGVFQRGAGDRDRLRRTPALLLLAVFQGSHRFTVGVDCALDGNDLVWLDGGQAPEAGEYFSVFYLYQPCYWFLGEFNQESMRSQFGGFLPFYGALSEKAPFAGGLVEGSGEGSGGGE